MNVTPEFAELVEELLEQAELRGYRKGWVYYRMIELWGELGQMDWHIHDLEWLAQKLGYRKGWATHKFYELNEEKIRQEEARRAEQYRRDNQRARQQQKRQRGPSSYRERLARALEMAGIPFELWPISDSKEFKTYIRRASLKYHPDTGGSHDAFLQFTEIRKFLETDLSLS